MRSLTVIHLVTGALLAAVAGSLNGCRQPETVTVESSPERPASELATMVHMADPRTASQLVKGFHAVEQNAWRWTAGRFDVVLRPPAGAAERGAILHFRFSIPETVIGKLGSLSLSAAVAGAALEPATYSKVGEHIYTRDVPAGVLAGDAVTVEFALDKSLPPSDADRRELGVVASSVGFEAK